jgi:hypothetical protein
MTRQQHLLIRLMEECAEVQKEISKILIFGLKDKPFIAEGVDHVPNDVRLSQEIVDVLTLIDMVDESGIKINIADEAIEKKRAKVEKYLEYSHSKGLLEIK